MKWFRRGVNPNSILFYKKINFLLLTFQRWTAQEKSHIFKNHVCHSTSFSSSYLFSIRQVHFSKTVVHTPTCWYFQKLFETIFNMRYYTKKYRFLSKTAKWNQKKITVLKCKKKCLLFRKLTKMSKTNSPFLGNSWNVYLCLRKAGGVFIWGLKKVVRLKQCPLYGFRFRDVWKGSI